MPVYKLTMLIDYVSDPGGTGAGTRVGGWSESVYWDALGPDTVTGFNTLCQKRAAMLPAGSSVIGQRYQQVDPTVGGSSTGGFRYPSPGGTGFERDIPQAAILMRIGATGFANKRPMYLRGIPDGQIVGGELRLEPPWKDAFLAYLTELAGWKFRGRDLTAPTVPIFSIDGTGNVVTEQPITLAVADMVRILRFRGGSIINGRFPVETVTSTTVFKLRGWNGGSGTGGKIRKDNYVYPVMARNQMAVSRIVVRKVGRPFFQYRGRRSKKR